MQSSLNHLTRGRIFFALRFPLNPPASSVILFATWADMHAHMARFLPMKGRTHVYAHVCSRCIGVMYNIALAIRIAVSVSVAFIPYGLRTCGITIPLGSWSGAYYGARCGERKAKSQSERELCYPSLPFDIVEEILPATFFYERLENSPEHREITNA